MSATYSTDSAGSSLSVDADNENWPEVESIRKIILEENTEEYVQWGGKLHSSNYHLIYFLQPKLFWGWGYWICKFGINF